MDGDVGGYHGGQGFEAILLESLRQGEGFKLVSGCVDLHGNFHHFIIVSFLVRHVIIVSTK